MKFPTLLRRRSAPQTPRSSLREPPPASPEPLDRDGQKRRYPMKCAHGVYRPLCPLCSPMK